MDHERYLSRLGFDPGWEPNRDLGTVARVQRAHVAAVPFETLSITGDPFGTHDGEGVSLAIDDLYGKVVERRRRGFCYELNGLFGWLLALIGFDIERRAAMVVTDGEARPPANHLTHVVALDRRYIVDVGLGVPTMRRPLPLDGTHIRTDSVGVTWRVAPSDRPDADFVTQYRDSTTDGDDGEWTDRYVFRDVPREMEFFAATCEYLANAPESPFTGTPVVTVATDRGHLKLEPDRLIGAVVILYRRVETDRLCETTAHPSFDDYAENIHNSPYDADRRRRTDDRGVVRRRVVRRTRP